MTNAPSVGEIRQQERLAALPAVYKTQHERLACELAMQLEEPGVIFLRHGYDENQALALIQTTEFSATLERVNKEVQESGLSFRTKARVIAEDLLQYGYTIATDEEASTSVRADMIQWFARIGGLEPPKVADKGAGNGGLNLTINFDGHTAQAVVANEPITIEAAR